MKRWVILILGTLGLLFIVAVVSVAKISTQHRANVISKSEVGKPMLDAPILRITDPQRGPQDAPITITYFTDFACESCSLTWPIVRALENEPQFKGKLHFVWKDFPAHALVFPESLNLHHAARCAASQGKFWEFQEAAFARVQDVRLRVNVLKDVLGVAGLNNAAMQSCIDSPGIASLVNDDIDEGKRLAITATPMFFINDKRFEGLPEYAMMVGNIRNMLAQIEYGKK